MRNGVFPIAGSIGDILHTRCACDAIIRRTCSHLISWYSNYVDLPDGLLRIENLIRITLLGPVLCFR